MHYCHSSSFKVIEPGTYRQSLCDLLLGGHIFYHSWDIAIKTPEIARYAHPSHLTILLKLMPTEMSHENRYDNN